MGLSDKIGKFFFTVGFICAVCFGLFKMCKVGAETIKEKVTAPKETSAQELPDSQNNEQN